MYIENSLDIYGDRKVKVDRVKSVKNFNLKRVQQRHNKYLKKQLKTKIHLTDPSLHRACEGKQTGFFFFFFFALLLLLLKCKRKN